MCCTRNAANCGPVVFVLIVERIQKIIEIEKNITSSVVDPEPMETNYLKPIEPELELDPEPKIL